jgi:hypothetical protein
MDLSHQIIKTNNHWTSHIKSSKQTTTGPLTSNHQNKQPLDLSHQIIEHKNTTTYGVGNPGSGLGQVQM